ncbi:uncharacterized protein LOC125670091 isoform X2 [Ostrea edulis]|uniref:uncharacterized protein LOC125670091 isoform X2 n=1 Tax=Ostrea edulis TaxID=37623 RepID=UPI00209436C6|nr:uncharacterized protein LOC125670091 isoform X2 [Ostrea edulis]
MKHHSHSELIMIICQYVFTHSSAAGSSDCNALINQFSQNKAINESTQPNTSILNVTVSEVLQDKMNFEIIYPSELSVFLLDYIKLQYDGNTLALILQKSIDVEYIYEKKNKYALTYFQVEFSCEQFSTVMNISVVDEDDNGPVFSNTQSNNCTLAGYTASSVREYVGRLETSPGGIVAADGDITGNNVTYSFLYGEPFEYEEYFSINPQYGHVNKTRGVTEDDPHDFMMIIQATEVSTLNRTKIAVLDVGVYESVNVVSSEVKANQGVLIFLQVLSGVLILAFTVAFGFIVHHRIKKHTISPKIPDSANTSKFDSMEAVTEDSFILENTIVLTETNQLNGGPI